MGLNTTGIELVKNIRELIDHSQCADMATNYHKGRFNHGNTCRLLHQFLNENATSEQIKEIYPNKLGGD